MRPVSVAFAARWIGLPERTVRHLAATGRLEGAYQPAGYSGKWLIPLEALLRITPRPADHRLLDLLES